jgi:hypothetical protein
MVVLWRERYEEVLVNQELVERVARAIYSEFVNSHGITEGRFDFLTSEQAGSYRRDARAAIAEITKAYAEWSGK